MIKVVVAGGFDPLHPGHLKHMMAARVLGDYLIVIINPDKDMVRKKGFCFQTLDDRIFIIQHYPFVDEVVVSIDDDGAVAKTLEKIRPNIFAKGGDRTPDNMPRSEIDTCCKIGCQIIYGIGEKYESSTNLIRKVMYEIQNIKHHDFDTKISQTASIGNTSPL